MAYTREKALDIARKLKANAVSEFELGNVGTSELFEQKVTQLLGDYQISRDELDIAISKATATAFVNDLGSTSLQNPFVRLNARTNLRKLWFEELANVVSEGYNCKVQPDVESGAVTFFGYDLDREVASFMFIKLAEVANELCLREMRLAKSNVGKPEEFDFKSRKVKLHPTEWMEDDVFVDSFHQGFREQIASTYLSHKVDESRKKEVDDYFEKNRNANSYRYYSSYRSNNLVQAELNQEAYEVGKTCGFNTSRKASKSPSALVVKKSVLSSEDTAMILVDVSGSMAWGGKLQQAKDGTMEFAKSVINKNYAVGVISFESSIRILTPKPVKEVSDKFADTVKNMRHGGSTNLTDALKAAQSRFLNRQVKRVIMIVTDGMPDNKESALSVANECKRQGIEIMAIGTDDADQKFLDQLTSKAGYGLLVSNERLALTMGEMAAKL